MSLEMTFSVSRRPEEGLLAHCLDLSAGGIRFLHLGPPPEPDEPLLVQFTLRRLTYSFCGVPLRVRPLVPGGQEVALAFTGADRRTVRRLREKLRG